MTNTIVGIHEINACAKLLEASRTILWRLMLGAPNIIAGASNILKNARIAPYSLKSWVHNAFHWEAFFSCVSLFRVTFSCDRWASVKVKGQMSIIVVVGSTSAANGYVFMHFCWVCVSGMVHKSYGSSWSVRLIRIKLIRMLLLNIRIKLIHISITDQLDP